MTLKEIKDFQRLLNRTEKLEDINQIKENLSYINVNFEKIRSNSLLKQQIDLNFFKRISILQEKVSKKKKIEEKIILKEEKKKIFIEEKKKKNNKIKKNILLLANKLKENVTKVKIASQKDNEVLNNVHKSIDSSNTNAEKSLNNLKEAEDRSLGLKPYFWLAIIVLIYLLISFIFL